MARARPRQASGRSHKELETRVRELRQAILTGVAAEQAARKDLAAEAREAERSG